MTGSYSWPGGWRGGGGERRVREANLTGSCSLRVNKWPSSKEGHVLPRSRVVAHLFVAHFHWARCCVATSSNIQTPTELNINLIPFITILHIVIKSGLVGSFHSTRSDAPGSNLSQLSVFFSFQMSMFYIFPVRFWNDSNFYANGIFLFDIIWLNFQVGMMKMKLEWCWPDGMAPPSVGISSTFFIHIFIDILSRAQFSNAAGNSSN